jgi:hypothetical protein
MTRKHFNSLAMHLAEVRPQEVPSDAWDAWGRSVRAVSDACKLANPQFDRERFEDACRLWEVGIRGGELTVIDHHKVR